MLNGPLFTLDPTHLTLWMTSLSTEGGDRMAWAPGTHAFLPHSMHKYCSAQSRGRGHPGLGRALALLLPTSSWGWPRVGVPASARDWPAIRLLCSQCLSHLLLLQLGASASRPTDGAAEQGVLSESDGANPSMESQVVSVLRHPASAVMANRRP